jgi:hypothetical protein
MAKSLIEVVRRTEDAVELDEPHPTSRPIAMEAIKKMNNDPATAT